MNLIKEKIEICIITPTWNNEDYTIRCFESIAKNTKVSYKIIWIDNASEKESRKKVRDFLEKENILHIAIFNDENKGFVGGTNQGIKMALKINPSYIVFQNNDTEVFEGWDEKMINVAESDPNIGLVGPITSPCDSWQSVNHLKVKMDIFKNLPKYNCNDHNSFSKKIAEKYKNQIIDVEMVAFFSTLFKTETIRQLGLLSTDFGIGFGDDDDYCMRAKKQNWKIVLAANVFIFHNHRTTFKLRFSEDKIKSMQTKNLAIFKRKHKEFIAGSKNPVSISYYISIVRKGINVLKRNGIKSFFGDLKNFIKHGRKYFK